MTDEVSAEVGSEQSYHDASMCGPHGSALSMQSSTQVDELLDVDSLDQRTRSSAPSRAESVDIAISRAEDPVSSGPRWYRQARTSDGDAEIASQNLADQCSCSPAAVSSCWRTSATHSLTQNFTRQILSEKQAIIHTVTLGWTITQYMSYSSNPFASKFKYSLVDDTGYNNALPISAKDSRNHEVPETGRSSQTVNGMARLLDAFAEIYGNPLGREARKYALDALEAATHAWSTQWLFDADYGDLGGSADLFSKDTLLRVLHHREFYAKSWLYAHGLLVKTRHSPSFIRTLAVFLFNMAEVPECAMSCMQPGESPVELQEHALLQLKALLSLVSGFAKALCPASIHRTMLESACSVMHWYGYGRDTSAALMHQRVCIINSVERDKGYGLSDTLSSLSSTIENVEAVSQATAARIIELKRSIIMIRDRPYRLGSYAQIPPFYPLGLLDQIDAFDAGIGARLAQFLANRNVLSPRTEGCICQ